jgi:sulfatase modifying factor 1
MKRVFETIFALCLLTFLSACMHATQSPLNQAISKGDMNGIRLLADQGANLNVESQKEAPSQGGVSSSASGVGKERPKFAVWDLAPLNINRDYAQALTSILVSEISKLEKYEVYSQENVRTLAGWTAERMQFGCTDSKCLTALGQMDIAKLISGSVGKIGNTYSISLNLFDTQNAKSDKSVSEFCKTEDDLIPLVQGSVRKLLGEGAPSAARATVKDSVTGMEFLFVRGGCFQMGDTFEDGRADEKPPHEVCVDDFYMGKYEVTQAQWKEVMGGNPSGFKTCGDHCPVEGVSWNDAQDFISRLNQKAGKKFRLPTEAEWEYAARSGGKREKWPGASSQSELGEYAWYAGGSDKRTHPVGEKRPNGLGLYDMAGNVREWCSDWYVEDYYRNSPKDNPRGPANGKNRVFRGGSWIDEPTYARTQFRYSLDPATRSGVTGFRLVLPAR